MNLLYFIHIKNNTKIYKQTPISFSMLSVHCHDEKIYFSVQVKILSLQHFVLLSKKIFFSSEELSEKRVVNDEKENVEKKIKMSA
jgi:hypothetical protein